MIRILFSSMIIMCASCSQLTQETNLLDSDKAIYKNWVLSRCLSFLSPDDASKQDALNTASAFLEVSNLPLSSFLAAEPLIQDFLTRNYGGSIAGTFNTKKCIDLYTSDELDVLYSQQEK